VRKLVLVLGALALSVVLIAVLRDRILALLTPSAGTQTTYGERYADGERGLLDVYRPGRAERAPVVVFFYGGSWQMGRRETYRFLGRALAAQGIVAVVPDYRVYPEVGFPDFLKDGARAVRWARDNAARHGGDPQRIFLMGHSAGAHIAAMLALDPEWLSSEGLDPAGDLRGWIGLSGPYDFLPLQSKNLIALFGGARRAESQPINFVSENAPPAFLATGDEDKTVEPRNTHALADALREKGRPVTSTVYPGRGHVGVMAAFVGAFGFLAPVAQDVTAFVHATPEAGP